MVVAVGDGHNKELVSNKKSTETRSGMLKNF